MNRTRVAVALAGLIGTAASVYAQSPTAPTFSKDVAPILYKNCTSCHRAGEIGPMPLVSFTDARPWAKAIANRVADGTMPPWHADPAHGQFLNDRRLSDKDRDDDREVGQQRRAGRQTRPTCRRRRRSPRAGRSARPTRSGRCRRTIRFPPAARLSTRTSRCRPTSPKTSGPQAIEVRPGNRSVVHHVIVYLVDPNAASVRRRRSPRRPDMRRPADAPKTEKGAEPNDRPMKRRPDRLAGRLCARTGGPRLRAGHGAARAGRQHADHPGALHGHRQGDDRPHPHRHQVGEGSAEDRGDVATLQNGNFKLPAGASDTRVDAELTLKEDMTVWSILPHTHMRGKKWEVTAIYPDGRSELILNVPKYDFNWQTDYIFKQPLNMPKGTKIRTSAWYDNSAAEQGEPRSEPKMCIGATRRGKRCSSRRSPSA